MLLPTLLVVLLFEALLAQSMFQREGNGGKIEFSPLCHPPTLSYSPHSHNTSNTVLVAKEMVRSLLPFIERMIGEDMD